MKLTRTPQTAATTPISTATTTIKSHTYKVKDLPKKLQQSNLFNDIKQVIFKNKSTFTLKQVLEYAEKHDSHEIFELSKFLYLERGNDKYHLEKQDRETLISWIGEHLSTNIFAQALLMHENPALYYTNELPKPNEIDPLIQIFKAIGNGVGKFGENIPDYLDKPLNTLADILGMPGDLYFVSYSTAMTFSEVNNNLFTRKCLEYCIEPRRSVMGNPERRKRYGEFLYPTTA